MSDRWPCISLDSVLLSAIIDLHLQRLLSMRLFQGRFFLKRFFFFLEFLAALTPK